jgi:hypothetical protein
MTVQTEFSLSATQNNKGLMAKYISGSARWQVYINTTYDGTMGKINAQLAGESGDVTIDSRVVPNIGRLYYVSLVRDYGNTISLYVDGIRNSVSDTVGNLNNDAADVLIGGYSSNVPNVMVGDTYESRIYNSALSDDWVFTSYMSESDTLLHYGSTNGW